MSSSPITLRAGEPTLDDGRMFARFLDEAADGFFRIMLGRRATEIIARAYTEPGHDLSYQNVTFAERGPTIIGMASGYTGAQHRQSSDRPLRQAAGYRIVRLAIVQLLCGSLWRFLNTVPDGDFYLQAIAVDPDARGMGVGSALFAAAEERAATSGSARLALDVVESNKRARQLYESRGLAAEARWPKHLWLGRFRILRMAKTLGDGAATSGES